jgi:hypothetical protein
MGIPLATDRGIGEEKTALKQRAVFSKIYVLKITLYRMK